MEHQKNRLSKEVNLLRPISGTQSYPHNSLHRLYTNQVSEVRPIERGLYPILSFSSIAKPYILQYNICRLLFRLFSTLCLTNFEAPIPHHDILP